MSQGALSERQFGDYILRHQTADFGERKPRHIIEAFYTAGIHPEGTKVGEMHWYGTTGTVHHIDVEPEHSRQGIASAMWQMGQEARPKPKHSADRTTQGDAWAKKVGGRRPRRSRGY